MDGPLAQGDRKSILVVDDIELNRTLIEAALSDAGYDVACVADGASAVDAVSAHSFDLVLMDLDMPGLDGYEATASIRQNGNVLPIAALTSRNSPLEKDRALKVGMTAHLARPMEAPALVDAVGRLVADHKPSQVFRKDMQDEILTRLGADRTRMFLEVLLEQCRAAQALIETAAIDDGVIDRKAHDLASTAGMLGYEEVWHRCRDLLVAPDPDMRRRAVRPIGAALSRAIAKIEDQVSTWGAVAA